MNNSLAEQAAMTAVGAIADRDQRRRASRSLHRDTPMADKLVAFHELFQLPRGAAPKADMSHMDNDRLALRLSLCLEETRELFKKGFGITLDCKMTAGPERDHAVFHLAGAEDSATVTHLIKRALEEAGPERRNMKETVDALTDRLYVDIGFATELGIDLTDAFHEVHCSNVSKIGTDGQPILREDGKIVKGPLYVEANLDAVIDHQIKRTR